MPRLIEIVLFLAPFTLFLAWRVLAPNPKAPTWLLYGLAGFTLLIAATLFWLRQQDAGDRGQVYIPAQQHDGRIVPARHGTGN